MSHSPALDKFDRQNAESYDDRWVRLAPLRDSLHLQIALIFQELSPTARMLCVGAGTGAELIALAGFFPEWRFMVVEPAAAMLDVCRRRTAAAGLADRCVFHQGFVHELPAGEPFDAATALLVSQFITDRQQRVAFFREIHARLRPAGYLVNADLSAAPAEAQQSLFRVWCRMLQYAGATQADAEAIMAAYTRSVAVSPVPEIEAVLTEAGFASPVLFSQSLLIRAWYAQRGA